MTDNLELHITPLQVKQLMDDGSEFLLLDCREPEEFDLARLESATLLPMSQLPERATELDKHRDDRIVVYCHHGSRSEMVTQWLRNNGCPNAQNMVGGIDAWSQLIDPSVPRY